MTIIGITGTDTGVGKTVVTAAMAVLAKEQHRAPYIIKIIQTGTEESETTDIAAIAALTGLAPDQLAQWYGYPLALAPAHAAMAAGERLPDAQEILDRLIPLVDAPELYLLEGAGGVLVPLCAGGENLADLAATANFPVLVVCRANLGTLNHSALTVEALRARGVMVAGLVIGQWPLNPGNIEQYNRETLAELCGVALLGVIPQESGALPVEKFAQLISEQFAVNTVNTLWE